MNPMQSARLAPVVLLAALLVSGAAGAKSSDRNQPMTIESTSSDCNMVGDNGRCQFTGNVIIVQGSLEIHADSADVQQKNGEADRVILRGKQATLKQDMDDGTTMNARADSMDYNIGTEVIVLTGNYFVESPRGSNSGQRMVYNTRTGNMQSGGDGTRVRTVIQPKNKSAAPAGKESK